MSTVLHKESDQLIQYIENNSEKIYRLAYSYMKNEQDALDVVQDAIYKGIKSVHQLKNKEHYKTWFYRIVVNTSLTNLKKKKRIVLVDQFNDEASPAVNQDHYIDLYEAIEKLNEDHRTIIQLRYFADLKLEEISEITKLNVSTVKTRLYRTLGILTKELRNEV
jgi:RNA polymerase sigma-70 factor (ECF subfamily)